MRSIIFEELADTIKHLTVEYEFNSFYQIYDMVIEELGGRYDPESYLANSLIITDGIEDWIGNLRVWIDDKTELDYDDRWIMPLDVRNITPSMVKNTLQILMLLYISTRHYSMQRSPYVRRSIQLFRFRVLYELMYCFSSNMCMYLTLKMRRQISRNMEETLGKTYQELYADVLRYGRGIYQEPSWVPVYHVNIQTMMNTMEYTNAC